MAGKRESLDEQSSKGAESYAVLPTDSNDKSKNARMERGNEKGVLHVAINEISLLSAATYSAIVHSGGLLPDGVFMKFLRKGLYTGSI